MIKDIKYQGYTAVPSDYECLDGELAGSYNMAPEDGAMHPVFPPQELFTLPQYHSIKFLHKTSAYKHYILYNENTESIAWIDADDTTHTLHSIPAGLFTATTIHKVDAVGNTLLVLTPDGVFYFLWKGVSEAYPNGYLALGYHLPELDLEFSFSQGNSHESEEYEANTGSGARRWSAILGDPEAVYNLENAIMAAANSVVADVGGAHQFAFPFFVRYAYRLYDGTSLTMHSAPILMIPTTAVKPTISVEWNSSGGDPGDPTYTGPAKIKASLTGYQLQYVGDYDKVTYLQEMWADIIAGVDIYISPLFYTYDQGKGAKVNSLGLYTKDIKKDIVDNANFFLLKRISLDELYYVTPTNNTSSSVSVGGRIHPDTPPASGLINVDFVINNDNIVVREQMTDDYDSHDQLMPTLSYGYNSRLNLAGLSKRLFGGYSPKCLFYAIGNSTTKETEYKVVIEMGDKQIVVASPSANVLFDSSSRVLWFYYPNPNAKLAYVKTGDDVQALTLKRHSFLNGAYYLGIDETVTTGETMPDTTTGDAAIVNLHNKLYTSEVNNPFFFPLRGISTIGGGDIIYIISAAKALSQGQFGQFPLYAFTTEGIWALKVTATGTFEPSQPFTEDVCENPDCITQLDGNVLFASSRGVMLLSGTQVQCVTESINSESPFKFSDLFTTEAAMTQWTTFLTANGYSTAGLTQVPFSTFLAGCRMIYDYVHQRIIIYNTGKDYAYIYSLKDHKWGMIQTDINYGINSYPEAFAVTDNNVLVNLSQDKTFETIDEQEVPIKVKGVLVTRPLKLDQPDALKTIDTIIQRGKFNFLDSSRTVKPIRTILYGSRDLYNWFLISSSTDHNLRGFSGSPYKYFRIVLLCDMFPDESVYGCTIQYNPRYLNRPR